MNRNPYQLLQAAFPRYDVGTLPALPQGFVDTSWRNDACPSFTNEVRRVQVFVDYADPMERECGPEARRFSLFTLDEHGDTTYICNTNEWSDMLALIEQHGAMTSKCLADRYPVKGSMPLSVVRQLYQLREAEVDRLRGRDVIVVGDLQGLDRGARAVVAGTLFSKCDNDTRHALLHDEHPHVRSCAVSSQYGLQSAS
ncbi:MAG TPA: hypothetical protein VJ846_04600 [Sphingomicrobium sp.]|nr:hypothetical protein [Sphingomicrobium sp.]